MNWTEWYRKSGDSTTYWYATGKRVGFTQIVDHAFYVNRAKILENVTSYNALSAFLKRQGV